EFCRANVRAKYNQPYSILGIEYKSCRKKRNCEKPISAKFSYLIHKDKIIPTRQKSKLYLPKFDLFGSTWMPSVCLYEKFLCVYLYNNVIHDGGTVQDIPTSVLFSLVNFKTGKRKT